MSELSSALSLGRLDPEYAHAMAGRYKQEFPWSDELGMELNMALNHAFAAEKAAMARFFSMRGFENREARYSILRILYFAGEPRTQNELRLELGVTSPNVTYLIDNMEKEGLVQRVPHPSDRRTGLVELTDQGRELTSRLTPAMAEFMGRMTQGFTEEEKHTFIRLMDRFHRNALNSYLQEEASI
jgi:DNA-binding MarR family transcriptional regulator